MFFVMLGIEYYYLLKWRHAQILQGKRRKWRRLTLLLLVVSLLFPPKIDNFPVPKLNFGTNGIGDEPAGGSATCTS
jgi:hypothetical protein